MCNNNNTNHLLCNFIHIISMQSNGAAISAPVTAGYAGGYPATFRPDLRNPYPVHP